MDLQTLLTHYRRRELDPAAGVKPLDVGSVGITASINQDSRVIALNRYHTEHGYITLSDAPPFTEAHRYAPEAVRAYRRSLAQLAGFGLEFETAIQARRAYLIEDALPCIELTFANGIRATCLTLIDGEWLRQWWAFSAPGLKVHISGTLWLQRCAYTQLTEGGPMPMPPLKTEVSPQSKAGRIILVNQALAMQVDCVLPDGVQVTESENGSVTFNHEPLTPGDTLQLAFRIVPIEHTQLSLDTEVYRTHLDTWRERWQKPPFTEILPETLDPLIRRALVYALHCCVPVDDDAVCMLTDHMLLPLAWNRDAYYSAIALLHWRADMAKWVRGHLIWMFETAERVDGLWGRSYLANGRVKDRGYQLDQQIFPLLELADYVTYTSDTALLDRLMPKIDLVIDRLLQHHDSNHWLFPTDETPADDPIALPYHLSSHILMWATFRKLAALDLSLTHDFAAIAAAIEAVIWGHFVTERDGQGLFSYACDGAGQHHLYHDANDIPLILAPIWGFCAPDDPIWRATIDFAFSPANQGGYYAGRLGSVHTPAPWPLGDVQDLLVALLTQDAAREQRTVTNLLHAAQWDGALPEASDDATGAVISRHWFVWPNAALIMAAIYAKSVKSGRN